MRRLAWCLVVTGALVAVVRADDHIAWTSTVSYMGRTLSADTSVAWLAAHTSHVQTGRVIRITREDLGLRWLLDPSRRVYLEQPLAPEPEVAPEAMPSAAPVRIQDYGWDHVPVYEWSVTETGETAVVAGWPCTRVVVSGEDDYATVTYEFWVTDAAPVDARRFFARCVAPGLDSALRAFLQDVPSLREGLAIETVMTEEGPIAGPIVRRTSLTVVEQAPPPAGIYDVPADYTRVATHEEWRR